MGAKRVTAFPSISIPLTLLLLAMLSLTVTCATVPIDKKDKVLMSSKRANSSSSTSIRAANCIQNGTHCHCLPRTGSNSCYKHVQGGAVDECFSTTCSGGYGCNCESNDICILLSSVAYSVSNTTDTSPSTFQCTPKNTVAPKFVVGHTTDFDIIAYQEFQLFVNSEQIGYSKSNIFKTFTAEIHSGDIIGIVAKRQSADTFGVKMQFTDLNGDSRSIDANWFATSTFFSEWLSHDFDPSLDPNWSRPSIVTTLASDASSSEIAWYWLNDEETVYFRYEIK